VNQRIIGSEKMNETMKYYKVKKTDENIFRSFGEIN